MSKPINNEFIQLRLRARERRDQAIAQIRAEYEETLKQITKLEQQLLGRKMPDHATLTAAVESVIPLGVNFTVVDLMRSLEAKDPGRVWCKSSVLRHVTKLRSLGLVRRVSRHKAHQSAVYIRDDQPEPFTKTLKDVVAEVVTHPMRTAEVVHAVLASGWVTTMNAASFRAHVLSRLRQAGFRKVAGKWEQ